MEKYVCIDWLSFTGVKQMGHDFPILPPWESVSDARADVPRFGYRRAIKFTSGLVIMFDGSTPTMGYHYIYSGQALANLGEYFPDGGLHILNWHTQQGHKCTRLDLAIDVKGEPSLLPAIKAKAERHDFTGTAHSATVVSSSDGKGLTVYVGSRTSERFVRIYDKAAQLGLDGHWTRIEGEIKGDSARTVARAITTFGDSGLDLVAKSVITRVCNFHHKTWEAVFSGEKIPIGTPKVEEKKTEEWIMTQVVKAVAKFELEHPEKRIVERMFVAIEERLFGK